MEKDCRPPTERWAKNQKSIYPPFQRMMNEQKTMKGQSFYGTLPNEKKFNSEDSQTGRERSSCTDFVEEQ